MQDYMMELKHVVVKIGKSLHESKVLEKLIIELLQNLQVKLEMQDFFKILNINHTKIAIEE